MFSDKIKELRSKQLLSMQDGMRVFQECRQVESVY